MQAAAPLVRTLLGRYPQYPVLITTVTPTGADRARQLFGDAVQLRYVPVDLPGSVRRFFDRVRPRLALILETELWPNLYAECGRRNIPLVLASARISPRSVGRYRRLVPLFRQTLSHGIVIAAQSARDAERFLSIGAAPERTHVTGNIKFDFEPSPETAELGARWRRDHASHRPVWVAGSTHEGEEAIVLDAHRRVREQFPDALLLLVPRHPPRFGAVRELLLRRGESFVTRSSEEIIGPEVAVMLGDSMGELTSFYSAADVAFVGGSLVPIGGHNLLEPAAVGKPVLTGPHCFNDEAAMRLLVEADAASIVTDSGQLARRVIELFSQPQQRAAMGDAGRRVVDENRGALDRLLRLVEPLLDEAAGFRPGGR
jgi:3-deoxy-D-manno-octulosonic-acid transferase